MFRKYQKSEYRQAFEYVDRLVSMFSKLDVKTSNLICPDRYMSFSEAIADRDFPLNHLEVTCLLKKLTGNWPNKFEVNKANPDSDELTEKVRKEEIAEYRSIYG